MGKYAVTMLEDLDSGFCENWNELVINASEGTFFHSFEWCKILETYGQISNSFKPYYIIAESTDKHGFIGVMSLFLNKDGTLLSPSYGDYGGPCLSPTLSVADKSVIIKEMSSKIEEVCKRKVNKVVLKSVSEDYLDYFSNLGYETKPRYFTFLLSVANRNMDDISQNFRRDAKRGIRKAEKSGIVSEKVSEKSLLKEYYEIYRVTMKKLGASVRSYSFFEILWDVLYPKGNLYVLLAKHNGKYVAGIISISWKKVLHIFGNVSLPESYKLYPNDLLYYETIKWAAENNHETVDFGLTPLNKESGLYQFKERWGGISKTLYVAQKDYRKSPKLLFSKLRFLPKLV